MTEEDHKQHIQELFLLQRVAQKINSILELDMLLEEIVNDVAQTFGYLRSGVLLKDEETNELEIAAVRGWTKNFHIKGDRFKIGEYGIVGYVAETGETYYSPDVRKDKYYVVSEESTNSELDIPLKVHGKLIGILNVQHHERNAFTNERIKLLEALAGHIATAIVNARFFLKERLEKERMLNELNEARHIQSSLFPANPPVIQGFNINGICIPCHEVGGDWYDFITLNDGRVGIVLADISGKGMGAALLMSSTRSILRLYAGSGLSPKEVLTKVNDILLKDFPNTKFVTLIYAILDPQKKTLVFANAGHLQPLLVNSSGSKLLETSLGMPLGITNSSFSECEVELTYGSRLYLYSDGVTETMNSSSEEYGTDRLMEYINNQSASVQNILENVHKFADGLPVSDDTTVVMVEAN